MVKRSPEKQIRVHIFMFERDKERLEAYFARKLKFSEGVRMIIRKFLDQVDEKSNRDAIHPKLTAKDMEIIE